MHWKIHRIYSLKRKYFVKFVGELTKHDPVVMSSKHPDVSPTNWPFQD